MTLKIIVKTHIKEIKYVKLTAIPLVYIKLLLCVQSIGKTDNVRKTIIKIAIIFELDIFSILVQKEIEMTYKVNIIVQDTKLIKYKILIILLKKKSLKYAMVTNPNNPIISSITDAINK